MRTDKIIKGLVALTVIGGTMLYLGWHDRFAERASGALFYGESRDRQDTTGGGSHDAKAGGGSRDGKASGGGSVKNVSNPFGPGVPTSQAPVSTKPRQDIYGKTITSPEGPAPTRAGAPGESSRNINSDDQPSAESLLGFNEPVHNVPTGEEASGPTISRSFDSTPFAPSGPDERWGTTFGTDPDVQAQQNAYNAAQDAINNRGLGDWLGDHLKNVLPGMYQKEPVWGDPATYADGTYHDAWSPAGAVASVLGAASPIPGTSYVTGMAGQQISDALGADHYTFGANGGWGTDKDQIADSRDYASDPSRAVAPGGSTAPASADQTAQGGTLGGKASQGGVQLSSIADTLSQKNPAQVAVNPTPKSYEKLTTYYSNGDKPKTANSPIY